MLCRLACDEGSKHVSMVVGGGKAVGGKAVEKGEEEHVFAPNGEGGVT